MSLARARTRIAVRLLASVLIGGLIGFERTFHGRPAGFRTHKLVCLASTLLMLVTVYQDLWMTHVPLDAIRTDPTRMAQGIMTGIGFLGAGAILRAKNGMEVRGLMTAATVWIAAALGVTAGLGAWFMTAAGTLMTLFLLTFGKPLEEWLTRLFTGRRQPPKDDD